MNGRHALGCGMNAQERTNTTTKKAANSIVGKLMTRKLTLFTILFVLAVAAIPSTASAVTVGLGDQSSGTFSDPRFESLGLKKVRVITPWNVALSRGDRAWLDDYLAAVSAAGVDPLVSFGAAHGSRCPARPCRLPTTATFERAFRAFRARWPQVRTLGVWNEANHRTQPTFRYPEQAGALLQRDAQALPVLPDRGRRRDRRPQHGPLGGALPHRRAQRAALGPPQLPRQQPASRPALRRHEAAPAHGARQGLAHRDRRHRPLRAARRPHAIPVQRGARQRRHRAAC